MSSEALEGSASMSTKPGWRTTEFYVTVFTALMPLVTAVFHKDFTGQQVQAWSVVAAGVASAAYAVSRATSKQAVTRARAEVESSAVGTSPGGSASQPSPVPMASVPIDTLASILARLDQLVAAEGAETGRRPRRTTESDRA